jgi:two-component system response regulator MtrA
MDLLPERQPDGGQAPARIIVATDGVVSPNLLTSLLGGERRHPLVTTLAESVALARGCDPHLLILAATSETARPAEICAELRGVTRAPVLLLAPPALLPTVCRTLRAGATAYLPLPPAPEWFRAQVDALLRHHAIPSGAGEVVTVQHLRLHLERREAWWQERLLPLTPMEFRLVLRLARSPGRVVPYSELLAFAGGPALPPSPAQHLLKAHMSRVRAKIGRDHDGAGSIVNVRSFGYMLERRAAEQTADLTTSGAPTRIDRWDHRDPTLSAVS